MSVQNDSKKSLETLAIEKNSCGRCRRMKKPTCSCSGGGGGGGGSDDKAEKQKSAGVLSAGEEEALNAGNEKISFAQVANLLSVDYSQSGKLVISSKAGLSEEEIEKLQSYLIEIKTSFEAFKNNLANQGISVKDFAADLDPKTNTLTITIPGNKHFYAFIQQLADKNLLPMSVVAEMQKPMANQELPAVKPMQMFFSPKPSLEKAKKQDEETPQQQTRSNFNPTPLNTKLVPATDGNS